MFQNLALGVSAYTVDSGDLTVITDTLSSNVTEIIPFGLGITAMLIGVSFIPKLLKKFTRG